MNLKKLAVGLAVIFEVIFVFHAASLMTLKEWKEANLSLLGAACMLLPFAAAYLAKKADIALPNAFLAVTVVFVFLAMYLGEVRDFYLVFWWWDLFLHAVFGSYAVISASYAAKDMLRMGPQTGMRRYILLTAAVAAAFAIALGALWEIFEYIGGYLFHSQMVKGGLEDTMTDLMANISAALLTAAILGFLGLRPGKRRARR